jgi:hypothetical protein
VIRLLWKELRYNWWIFGLGCGVALLLSVLGDPLFFRGDSSTDATGWLTLTALLIGLRAYSSELGGDTVQFLGSRPIRWWQVWIAKLVAGLLQVILLIVVAAGLYALFVPDQYRLFLVKGITTGGWESVLEMAFLFGIGFAVSILMPGVPLSAAALALAAVILFGPFLIMGNIQCCRLDVFAEDTVNNAGYPLILAIPLASLVVARGLPRMSAKRRWVTWMAFPVAAMVIGGILAGFFGTLGWWFNAPSASYEALSPNGKWAVCHAVDDRMYLMDTRTGKRRLLLRGDSVTHHSWSADSGMLAYRQKDNSIGIVSVRRMRTALISETVHSSQGAAVFAHRPSNVYVAWSPTGDRLALVIPGTVRRHVVVGYRVAIFSPDGKILAFESNVPMLVINEVRHYEGRMPALVGEHLLFWPSKDGGRFAPVSYFEMVP